MEELYTHENDKLLYEMVGMLYEIINADTELSKFTESDAMIASVLMLRHGNKEENSVSEWIAKCSKKHPGLLDESSFELLKKVSKSFKAALVQSVTIVKANNVTLSKNYSK